MQVSCVSGTYNRSGLLRRMIDSVRKSCAGLEYEIVIVDCNSTDGSREWLREQSDVVLIEHPEPRGSVIAFNDGFRRSRGECVVTLNDDIAVEGDTILRAYNFMQARPDVGQVAFAHRYLNRRGYDPDRPLVQKWFGYEYAQCGMTRRWLGNLAGWWGEGAGLVHYGGDAWLSMRIWELGYRVTGLRGCSVMDWEHDDELRSQFSKSLRDSAGVHPDNAKFLRVWKGRMGDPDKWVPAPVNSVITKAAAGTLRTLRFKGMMSAKHKMRTGLIDVLSKFGPTLQVNQSLELRRHGQDKLPRRVLAIAKKFEPDFIMLQMQRPGIMGPSVPRMLRRELPYAYVMNWDADTHYPLLPYHWKVAKECHLQLTVSPDLFEWYHENGVYNIGYWPIAVEACYFQPPRTISQDSYDVAFLGALYGRGIFPEANTRLEAVRTLLRMPKVRTVVKGTGWNTVGIKASYTGEQHLANATLYASTKMALSVSQTKDLWGYTSDRLYNICASGCPALVQEFSGMVEHGFEDGKTCIAWSSTDEMARKVRYYLAHPQRREAIGKAGKQLMKDRHMWDHRIWGLFSMIQGLGVK